jgi:mannose-6-phosphate isomerase-like protein (cupin superfamily)
MKMKMTMAMMLLGAAMALPAGDPKGFAVWSASQLQGVEKQLSTKITATQKFASEPMAKYDNHALMLGHRQGTGEAELHETQVDIFFVQSGQATLIVGGTVNEPKTTAPHEIRGASITGGESKKLGAGDVVHIPAGTAHQLLLDSPSQFTYVIVKIDVK